MNFFWSGIFVVFMLSAGIAFANEDLEITYPLDDITTGSDIVLTAETSTTAICEYFIDSGGYHLMATTGGTSHSQPLSGLASGTHHAKVHCFESPGHGSHGMEEDVRWSVNPAIPEFSSFLLPILLCIASFGLVSLNNSSRCRTQTFKFIQDSKVVTNM